MSLESYKKNLEAQRTLNPKQSPSNESYNSKIYSETPQVIVVEKRKGWGCLLGFTVGLFLLTTILGVAAIKNPSPSEAKSQLRQSCIELALDLASKKGNYKSKNKDFHRFLLNAFPSIIEGMVSIHTTNYVFFTSYEITAVFGEEPINIVSGIILFGKAMPMKTDLNSFKLQQYGIDL